MTATRKQHSTKGRACKFIERERASFLGGFACIESRRDREVFAIWGWVRLVRPLTVSFRRTAARVKEDYAKTTPGTHECWRSARFFLQQITE